MSETITSLRDTIKKEVTKCQPGILPPGKSMASLIGHTVINISDQHLTKPQIEAFQTDLTFCPTPGLSDKSMIWNDFKEFHRRLIIKHHFYNDNQLLDTENLQLVQFLSDNLDDNENPFKNKSMYLETH